MTLLLYVTSLLNFPVNSVKSVPIFFRLCSLQFLTEHPLKLSYLKYFTGTEIQLDTSIFSSN